MSARYTQILNDVDGIVAAEAPTFTRRVQKLIEVLPEDVQNLPLCIIIPDLQSYVDGAYEGQIILKYKVGVALVFASNYDLTTLGTMIDARDLIRKKLNVQVLPTASGGDPCGVYDSDFDLNPVFDTEAIKNMYDYSLMEFYYLSAELRN